MNTMTELPTHRAEPIPVRSALFYHAVNQAVAVAVATLNIHLAPDFHDAVTASDAEALRSLLESRLEPDFLASAATNRPAACACPQGTHWTTVGEAIRTQGGAAHR